MHKKICGYFSYRIVRKLKGFIFNDFLCFYDADIVLILIDGLSNLRI